MLWFVDCVRRLCLRFWNGSDFTERMFLLGAWTLLGMMVLFTYICTQAFYGADVGGYRYNFDLIYSSDSGYLVQQDVFRNIGAEQNDLRQPLYGVFSTPFAQAAWLLSRCVPFLPVPYTTVLQLVQLLLFLVGLVLLSRMMELQGAEKALFLVLLCVTWPVWIFALTAEQYLMAVFYLLLLLYLRQRDAEHSLSYIAATGSLLTSGIWFPVITWDRRPSRFVRNTVVLCGAFFAVTILSGRLTTFLDMPQYILKYGYYSGAEIGRAHV